MNFRFVRAILAICAFALFATVGSSYYVQAQEPLNNREKSVEAANQSPFSSAAEGTVLYEIAGAEELAIYIVQFQDAPLASYRGQITGLAATSPAVTGAPKLDADSPASQAYRSYLAQQRDAALTQMSNAIGRADLNIRHTYEVAYNGVAIELTPQEAAAVARLPEVKQVVRNFQRTIQTDTTPEFINAHGIWDGGNVPGGVSVTGEGIVVGIIDTGINMDHPSFAATDGDGYTHTNPRGKYYGWCDPAHPNYDANLPCNDKLIGVYTYPGGGASPIDNDGHGSHVAATAAGNALYDVEYDGVIFDHVSGIAPQANIISYRVCATNNCNIDAILAAIDDATADAVDVINYSIGSGPSDPWADPDSLAYLNARDAGIFVATSAGNDGPGAGTVGSPANSPWMISVANTTIPRIIANTLDVTGPEPVPAELQDIAAVRGLDGPAEFTTDIEADIVYAGDVDPGNELGCSAFPANAFDDSVALIQRGECPFSDKVNNAHAAGATAVIIFNNAGGPPIVMSVPDTSIHSFFLTDVDGAAIVDWVQTESDPTVHISTGTASITNPDWADIMANLSSRGPNVNRDLLKPDIGAPGTNILAAYAGDADSYGMISGTSMASPHVAGAGALLRELYPDWTPAEIQSALMMTSLSGVVVKEDAATPSDPFDVGAGRLDLTNVALTGLVLDETTANFEAADPALGGDPTTLNLASLAKGRCTEVCSWTRTFRSVADETLPYAVMFDAPAGMVLTANPPAFTIDPGDTQEVTFTADVSAMPVGDWAFAEVQLVPVSAPPTIDFTGDFDLSNWTFTNDPVDVNGSYDTEPGPPIELYITSGNDGEEGSSDFWITIPEDGVIRFDWGSESNDEGCFDSVGVVLNGVYDELACTDDNVPFFTASYELAVSAGDTFGFRAWTDDGLFGAITLGVTNFAFFQPADGTSHHLPVAVMPALPVPIIDVDPDELNVEQKPGEETNHTLTISNLGGVDLEWTIAEDAQTVVVPMDLTLDATPMDGVSPYSMILDGGVANNAIGVGGAQFIWFNRFTPNSWNFPVTLDEVQVMFGYPGSTAGINTGELVDIYLYEDADGNPANGATHRASLHDQEVQAVDGVTWSVYSLDEPVVFDGPGDIIIAVVNRTAGVTAGTFPAFIDQSSGSKQRSWAGFGIVPGDPPDITAFPNLLVIDDAGFPGNWMIRGYGEAFVACDNPADVSWLEVAPNAGTTLPESSTDVTVTIDSTGMSVGTYQAFVCIESNDPETPLTVTPVTMEVIQTPVIDVSPAELESTQPSGSVTTQTLTIGNTGDGDLEWTIDEDAAEAGLSPLSTELLYDQTANTTTEGALAIYDLDDPGPWAVQAADDFVVPDGATWTVHTVDAYGFYQDFTNLPGVNVYFYEDDGGLPGDELYAYPNLQPTQDNNGHLTFDLPEPAEFPAGAYWLSVQPRMDYFADGRWYWFMESEQTNNEFAWRNPGGGYDSGCNNWGYSSNCDFSHPDLSFQLTGTRSGVCLTPSDIAWLSVDPASGTTAPESSDDVTVTLDGTGLTSGVYSANLCVSSNDPANPLVVVPVEMTVEEAQYGVELAPAMAALSGAPGETVTYELTVTNNGNVQDTFTFSASDAEWAVGLPDEVTLAAGDSADVSVTVAIPATAAGGDDDTVTITATSQGDSSATASSTLTTTAVTEPPVDPETFSSYMPIIIQP